MSEQTKYAPGTPSWVDIGTDVDAAKKFYGSLFGWGAQEAGPARGDGRVRLLHQEYFAVDDTDATVASAEAIGGSVMMAPMDIPVGRFSVLTDPQGASFGVIRLTEPPD